MNLHSAVDRGQSLSEVVPRNVINGVHQQLDAGLVAALGCPVERSETAMQKNEYSEKMKTTKTKTKKPRNNKRTAKQETEFKW